MSVCDFMWSSRMPISSISKIAVISFIAQGLIACGGTSTDTEGLITTLSSNASTETTGSNDGTNSSDTSSGTDTGGGSTTPEPEPEPTPAPTPGVNQAPNAVISADPVSGVASLTVNVNANQSTDDSGITSYRWNFGDGTQSQSPVTSHIYSTPGNYTVTLTVTDGAGLTDMASTVVHVFSSVDNSQVVVPGNVYFYDSFEYSVARNGDPSTAYDTFVNQGGWEHVKGENMPNNSGKGYLYTVTQIPGYNGTFPGRNSNSVLAMESLPDSLGFQTDYYLQFGNGQVANAVPGDIWFQFWIYPNRYDDPTNQNDQMSIFENRFKFIYPCDGGYPCQDGNIKWLNTLGFTTGEPFWANTDNTELFITTMDPYATEINYDLAPPYDAHKIGQTDVSENITPNRWTLVKIHYDTSTTSGTFEAWLKPMGGSWVKVAEWIDGVTPNFSWDVPAGEVGGHRMFRMPTTVDDHDSWIYMDDFAMATTEADLPVYPY